MYISDNLMEVFLNKNLDNLCTSCDDVHFFSFCFNSKRQERKHAKSYINTQKKNRKNAKEVFDKIFSLFSNNKLPCTTLFRFKGIFFKLKKKKRIVWTTLILRRKSNVVHFYLYLEMISFYVYDKFLGNKKNLISKS